MGDTVTVGTGVLGVDKSKSTIAKKKRSGPSRTTTQYPRTPGLAVFIYSDKPRRAPKVQPGCRECGVMESIGWARTSNRFGTKWSTEMTCNDCWDRLHPDPRAAQPQTE